LWGWYGSSFDEGGWERQRANLHHDDFHHRFYQYLGAAGSGAEDIAVKGISCMLSNESIDLPEAAAKAFNHWLKISNNLHVLFNHAPAEAVADDTSVLARLALRAVERNNYPAELAQEVRDQARIVLARSAEANRERIAAAIAEPMRLLNSIDGFIMRVQQQRPRNALPHPEAEAQARKFLEWCRQLDRALSTIPVRLREGAVNDC
jgi:hypothetical protein